MILEAKIVAPTTLFQTTMQRRTARTITKTITGLKESQKRFLHPVSYVGKQTNRQRNANMESVQPTERLSGTKDGKTESGPRKSQSK